ncbi:MAG: hypothetical protein U0Q15_14810 [Kineosporiaceae bacterium]
MRAKTRAALAAVAIVAAAGVPLGAAEPAQAATSLVRGVHAGGPARQFSLGAGDDLTVLFTALPGQTVTAAVTAGTYPASCDAKVWLVSPSGTALTPQVCGGRGVTLPATVVSGSGLFGVRVAGQGSATGAVTVAVSSTGARTITPNIGALSVTVPAGGSTDLAFRLEQGEFAHVELGAASPSGGSLPRAQLLGPTGAALPGDLDHATTTTSGVHRIRVTNPASFARTVPVDLTKGRDQVAWITPGASGVRVQLPLKGQQARVSFSSPAGYRVVVTPSDYRFNGDQTWSADGTFVGPDGKAWGALTTLRSPADSGDTVPVGGSQTLVIDPPIWLTGSLTVAVALVKDPAPVALTVGTPLTLAAPEPWTNPSATFSATRGELLDLSFTSSAAAFVALTGPDGGDAAYGTLDATHPFRQTLRVPQTGTYRLVLNPTGAASAPIQVSVTKAGDAGITLGTPRRVTLGADAEAAIVLDIDPALAAGRALTFSITDSTVGELDLQVVSSSYILTPVHVAAGDASGTLTAVPTAGQYQILILNNGPAGQFTLRLS